MRSCIIILLIGFFFTCQERLCSAWVAYPRSFSSSSLSRRSVVTTVLREGKSLDELVKSSIDKDDKRNVPSLQEWATAAGVRLGPNVNFVDYGFGDWGVGLNEACERGTSIMVVPKDLILSSDLERLQPFRDAIHQSMSKNNLRQEYYVPECLLVLLLLWEKSKGNDSIWSPWLECLPKPKSFNTGIYLDDLERSQMERIAPEFLRQQDLQWEACLTAIQELVGQQEAAASALPKDLKNFLTPEDPINMKALVKWAFSVVFTRSWRPPANDGTAESATLVPIGDFLNHDSQQANVIPRMTEDGSLELVLKADATDGSSLFLSYGMTHLPARFLVMYGFWDRSADFIDANLTVPEEFPVDRSRLVISSRTGELAEDVFNLAVYQVLKERDPDTAKRLSAAQQNQDDATLQELCSQWDLEAAMYLRLHVLKLLGETYPEMNLAPENMSESPRRYGMIARYNNAMRDSWLRVGEYLDEEIEIALRLRQK